MQPTFHVCERSLLVEDTKHMSNVGIGSAVTFKLCGCSTIQMACRPGAVDPVSAMSPFRRCDLWVASRISPSPHIKNFVCSGFVEDLTMQATSVKDAQIRTRLPQRVSVYQLPLRARPHSTIFLGLIFPRAGGLLILAHLEMSARLWTLWRKAGESSSVEQILDNVSQVVRMICRATRFPRGEISILYKTGELSRRGRIGALLSKRRI